MKWKQHQDLDQIVIKLRLKHKNCNLKQDVKDFVGGSGQLGRRDEEVHKLIVNTAMQNNERKLKIILTDTNTIFYVYINDTVFRDAERKNGKKV